MTIGERENFLPLGKAEHLSGRIARRADVEQLRPAPDILRNRSIVGRESTLGSGVRVVRARAGEQSSALVNLIEGIGADYHRFVPFRIDDGLRKGEQRLARAVDRQYLGLPVDRTQAVA